MAEPTIRFRGHGDEHHQGIPARALTTEEYEALTPDLRKLVRESSLYDFAGYREKMNTAASEARKSEARTEEAAPRASEAKEDGDAHHATAGRAHSPSKAETKPNGASKQEG